MSIQNRYDFVLYFEVVNGNPNGDPDAGNMPRIDPQTSLGLVTDVCIKRKIRNYVQAACADRPVDLAHNGYDIFVTEGAVLNSRMEATYKEYGLDPKAKDARELARQYMCRRYFDVRTFGAVMDTGDYKCGQVRGPVQLCFGRSVDSIYQQEVTITRMAATTEKDDATKNRTMGRKYVVPYGLYRMEGFFSPADAAKTGFTDADLEVLWDALLNMFEIDHSAARGRMATRKLVVFEHASALGNAPSFALFDLVTAKAKSADRPAREFSDYTITVGQPPEGVTVKVLR
jgi:CRISPR-associated protein Csd2